MVQVWVRALSHYFASSKDGICRGGKNVGNSCESEPTETVTLWVRTEYRKILKQTLKWTINPFRHSPVVMPVPVRHSCKHVGVYMQHFSHETKDLIPVLAQTSSNSRSDWNLSETQEDEWVDGPSYKMILWGKIVGDGGFWTGAFLRMTIFPEAGVYILDAGHNTIRDENRCSGFDGK